MNTNLESKTVAHLMHDYDLANPGSLRFEAGTMRYWGDSMQNYGVRRRSVTCFDWNEAKDTVARNRAGEPKLITVNAWELYRKEPVNFGVQTSLFLHPDTFKIIHEAEPVTESLEVN